MNHIRATILTAILLISGAFSEDYSNEKLDELLNRLETNLSTITTLDTTFKQYKHISMFDEIIEADGRLLFQQPNNIRFEITHPFQSVLIVKGKKVAKYEMNHEDWRRLKLHNTDALALVMNQIADWMKGNFRGQSRVFALSAKDDNDTILVLTPKPAGFAKIIECIEIRLADNCADFKSITIREPDGDHTVLKFIADTKGTPLSADAFDTTRNTPVMVPMAKEAQ